MTVSSGDPAAHGRRIVASGGAATAASHGRWHMAVIGTASATGAVSLRQ